MNRYIAILLLACLAAVPVQAGGTIFYNISPKDGLSYSSVRDITQDKSGFIWIATLKGLNRFDGYNVIKYIDDDESGLDTDVIEALETVGNDILLGTDVGLFRYDTSKERFFRVEADGLAARGGWETLPTYAGIPAEKSSSLLPRACSDIVVTSCPCSSILRIS